MKSVGSWLIAALLVFVANALFLALNVLSVSVPAAPLVERVQTAFQKGELTDSDWLRGDWRRGYNQYNDCLILTMALDRDGSVLRRASGPLAAREGEMCPTLRGLVTGSDAALEPYTRYWHGYVPVAAFGLQLMSLASLRVALRLLGVGALASLALAAVRRRLWPVVAIAATGLLFWGLPFYGQGLSHAPGDAFVLLGLAGLVHWWASLVDRGWLVAYCAVFGAGVGYFEFMTGQIPTATALLIPVAWMAAGSWRPAALALIAFAMGGIVSVLLKQLLALAFVGFGVTSSLAGQFEYYTGMSYYTSGRDEAVQISNRVADPLLRLVRRGYQLTYGSLIGAGILYIAALISWAVAGVLAFRTQRLLQLAPFVVGVFVVVVWIAVFPAHTMIHSMMVRLLFVPIALGFSALAWQLTMLRPTPVETRSSLNARTVPVSD